MSKYLKLLFIALLSYGIYQHYSGGSMAKASLTEQPCTPQSQSATCLQEHYGDSRYILSKDVYEFEVQPYMNKLARARPSTGTYAMTTTTGKRIEVNVQRTVTKGAYCPKKKRHLQNVEIRFDTAKPMMVASE